MIRYTKCAGILLIIVCTILTQSCKKQVATKTKVELLTTASWKMNSCTSDPAEDYDGDGTPETNLFAIFPECVKDDYTTFVSGGSASIDMGTSKCDPEDPQKIATTWALNDDQTKLTIDGTEFTIVELNTIQLKLTSSETLDDQTYSRTTIYVH